MLAKSFRNQGNPCRNCQTDKILKKQTINSNLKIIFYSRKLIFKMNNNLVTHNEMSKCPLTCFKNSENHAEANALDETLSLNIPSHLVYTFCCTSGCQNVLH